MAGLAHLDRLISAVAVAVVLARILEMVLSVATVDLAARMALLVLQELPEEVQAEAIRLLPERMDSKVRLLVAELAGLPLELMLEERERKEQTDKCY
jgi:carbon starvation protein CstA